MLWGPIIWRETTAGARRWTTWSDRASGVAVPLVCIGIFEALARWVAWERTSVAEQSLFAFAAFGVVAFLSAFTAMLQPTMVVAPSVARERDKKTLDALLTTELTGAEIAVGKLVAGLLNYAWGMLASAPLVVVLVWWWGVDYRLALLMYAGCAATAFAGGALALAISTRARNPAAAHRWSVLFLLAWMWMPLPVAVTTPLVWPALAHWISPIAWWLIETGPCAVLAHLVGIKTRGTLVETTSRMIAWEVGIGSILLIWTSVRFRALCRAAEDREGRRWLRRLRRLAAPKRPPCGDDGVYWYEKYNTRGQGPFERGLNFVIFAGLFLAVGLIVVVIAVPAFSEFRARGYGAGPGGAGQLEMNPLVWLLLSIKHKPPSLPDGMQRVQFNVTLRMVSAFVTMLFSIVLAGFATEGITYERTRDTLSGLLTTPLTASEILGSKARGALWRARWALYFLLGFWTIGLISGAVHPLGYLAALVSLTLTCWFCLAIGTYGALVARDSKGIAGYVTMSVTLMIISGIIPLMMPTSMTTVLAGCLSPAWLCHLPLLSYEDVRDIFTSGPYRPLEAWGIASHERFGAVAATCLIGWGVLGGLAFFLTRASLRNFDRLVGRPIRPATVPTASDLRF